MAHGHHERYKPWKNYGQSIQNHEHMATERELQKKEPTVDESHWELDGKSFGHDFDGMQHQMSLEQRQGNHPKIVRDGEEYYFSKSDPWHKKFTDARIR